MPGRYGLGGTDLVSNQDPCYAHLARVNLDGSSFVILTESDRTHSWSWSSDEHYFLDAWSRVDQLPVTVLRDAKSGGLLVELQGDNTKELLELGWHPPERFVVTERDGTTSIYGVIVRPKDLDPKRKYPVIEEIYAGPQDFYTPKSFTLNLPLRQRADQGHVVIQLDSMGTNWRALIFHGGFYKAAVADSGCHGNRIDKLWWNEQWMGWPVDDAA